MAKKKDIIVTTGDLKQDYDIIAPVTAEGRYVDILIDDLRDECYSLGGNAVICVQMSNYYNYEQEQDYVALLGTAVKIKE